MNHLYFGDCLDVLKEIKENHPQPFIDLIYIDPPFNSKRNYNVLFESMDMKDANAQKQAFADTWSNYSYIDELNEMATLHKDIYTLLKTFHELKSISDSATAYLTTMSIRIYYMHKLLKDTGSFYLHCDPTMSHYLKLICDMIFGERNCRNEITWKRTNAHNDAKTKFADVNDIILFYSKSNRTAFFPQYTAHDEKYVTDFYKYDDSDGKGVYQLDNMAAPAGGGMSAINKLTGKPNGWHIYKGFGPPDRGWRYSPETMSKLDSEGRIYFPKRSDGSFDLTKRLRLKRYLNEQKGNLISNNWDDINALSAHESEALGYPTQKPEALLDRIIKASSTEDDVVADFFCGCGTTIAVAQRLNRKWLGADISHLAIRLIVKRLTETYGLGVKHNIKMHGLPKDIASAKELAQNLEGGRIGFQDWAIEVMLNGVVNEKKVADGGYDGYLTFNMGKEKYFAIIETKSGKLTVKNMREFVNVVETQKAAVGIFVCFAENVTSEMVKKAKDAGHIKLGAVEFPMDKIQIITIENLFEGKQPQRPGAAENETFKKSKRNEGKASSKGLFD
jgi:site-specific DNA-methyltransferase (adenine-specific)